MRMIDMAIAGQRGFDEAARILKSGGIVAFPTETVYGVGCDAMNKKAVKRIYEIKGRSYQKPLAFHISQFDVAKPYISNIPKEAQLVAEHFMPGPVMSILKCNSKVPEWINNGGRKIGIRVPSNKIFNTLATTFKGIIAATSANRSGNYSPICKEHVENDLGDMVDLLIYDNDEFPLGIESTILDFTTAPFRVLRNGFIDLQDINSVCGVAPILSSSPDPKCSKKKLSGVKLILFEGDRENILKELRKQYDQYSEELNDNVGVIVTENNDAQLKDIKNLKVMGDPSEAEVISRNFYSCLRDLDKIGVETILVEGVVREGIGWAIMERLTALATEIIKV